MPRKSQSTVRGLHLWAVYPDVSYPKAQVSVEHYWVTTKTRNENLAIKKAHALTPKIVAFKYHGTIDA